MKKYVCLVLLSVALMSCGARLYSGAEKVFTVRQGNHYCDQTGFQPVNVTGMTFQAKFDSSCIYTSINPENQTDINKLWGFNEGLVGNSNSARIGWFWKDGALWLAPYTHYDGQHFTVDSGMVSVPLEVYVPLSISLQDTVYRFEINGKKSTLPRKLRSDKVIGYQLYPYFGGDEVAPHDVSIYLK